MLPPRTSPTANTPERFVSNRYGGRASGHPAAGVTVTLEAASADSWRELARGTTDADGRIDVSPKGDPPGFVHVIDEVTIALPERPGNRRADGYLNVLQQPGVGTLFVVPGRGDTLRINGRATIVADADYFDAMAVDGKRPILALEIDVAEVFFHCPKAFLRSDAWKPETWDPTALPSTAQIAQTIRKGADLAELEDYYREDNQRKLLY